MIITKIDGSKYEAIKIEISSETELTITASVEPHRNYVMDLKDVKTISDTWD